jgi:antitoxin (DNA-binding transcriptional repressor) of toxin-antitoxin stability system
VKVGTKELKNRLSHYLRLVRKGAQVQVTDHGTIVAELRAARALTIGDEACLQALEQQGVVTVGRKRLSDFEPLVAGGDKTPAAMPHRSPGSSR